MESISPTTEQLKNIKYAPQVYKTTLTLSLDNNTGIVKVHVFWEGHKNWKNLHRQFDSL